MKRYLVLWILIIFITGFCFGAAYQQEKGIALYQDRIDVLAQKVAENRYDWEQTLYRIENDYRRYYE